MTLHVEILGDGPPLVIAHGLLGSGRNWGALAKRLARARRVLVVDMRNHGDSPWDDAMDYPAMAQDLADAVAGAGGRADVLGHSMGGKAAMALALTRPETVARLIVADIAPVAYGHSHADMIAAMQALDRSAVTRRADADRALAGAIPDPAVRAFALHNLAFEPGAAPRWRPNLAALAATMPALIGWPDLAGRFDGPTLFLRGGRSDYVTDAMAPRIAALFPAARIETIADAGHWLHAERPEPFLAAVERFLA